MGELVLSRLTRRHAGAARPALDALDLTVRDGELVIFVGPSGCGKSTALRLIAGLDAPDDGRVLLDGRDLAEVAPQARDVAMVFQGYALYPHMTVAENIAFPLRMRSTPRAERDRRVDEVLAMLGLAPLRARTPAELSGGERQRVAMGRAIVRRPKVFLFDEPLANLDAALRASLRAELSQLLRTLGTTAIYVTHDQAEAMTIGDRIVVLSDGRLQQAAAPRAVYETPANLFVASFLGAPPMNQVSLTRAGDRFEGSGVSIPAAGRGWPDRVVLGLRPEHLAIGPFAGSNVGPRSSPEGADQAPRGSSDAADPWPDGRGPLSWAATVVDLEPLGPETHVTVKAADLTLRLRVPGFDAPERGATLRVAAALGRAHVFDAATGDRIPGAPPRETTEIQADRASPAPDEARA